MFYALYSIGAGNILYLYKDEATLYYSQEEWEKYKDEPMMCDGQCTLQDLNESIGNDNAESGLFSLNR